MNNLEGFFTVYRAFLTALVTVSSAYLESQFQSLNLPIPQVGRYALFVIAAMIFLYVMESFAQSLVNNWSWLRKVIFGKAYIDGIGVDITYSKENKEVLYGAFTEYRYAEGKIIGKGEAFDLNGEFMGRFELQSFMFSESLMKYGFEGIFDNRAKRDSAYYGYGEIHFSPGGRRHKKFHGFYIDNRDMAELTFEGEFLDNDILREIADDHVARKKYLKSHIKNFADERGFELLGEQKLKKKLNP